MTFSYLFILYLRAQIIDEADRLLAQSFQDWLAEVLAATRPPAFPLASDPLPASTLSLPYPDALAPAFLPPLPGAPPSPAGERTESSCQKLLFSATLTRDPGKIAALDLRDPKYFVVQVRTDAVAADVGAERFAMPASLTVRVFIAIHVDTKCIYVVL